MRTQGLFSLIPRLATPLAAIGALTLAGCASSGAAMYNQALGRAQASIDRAEQSGAYEQSSGQLTSARNKLAKAQQLADDGDNERAARLADEARLDAELASAIAQNQEMQAAVDEVNDGIATLREELERNP